MKLVIRETRSRHHWCISPQKVPSPQTMEWLSNKLTEKCSLRTQATGKASGTNLRREYRKYKLIFNVHWVSRILCILLNGKFEVSFSWYIMNKNPVSKRVFRKTVQGLFLENSQLANWCVSLVSQALSLWFPQVPMRTHTYCPLCADLDRHVHSVRNRKS